MMRGEGGGKRQTQRGCKEASFSPIQRGKEAVWQESSGQQLSLKPVKTLKESQKGRGEFSSLRQQRQISAAQYWMAGIHQQPAGATITHKSTAK